MTFYLAASVVALMLLAACQSTPQPTDSADRLNNPADLYIELGTVYLARGRLDEALKNAHKALLANAESASAHNLLGVIYQRSGKNTLAGQHYRHAVALDKQNPYALNALGQYICAHGEPAEADVYFARALQNPLYPTPWIAAHNAGLCMVKNNNLRRAGAYYRQALQSQPNFAPALLRMAALGYRQGDFLSARHYLQRYGQVEKHSAESLWLGIRTERQLGNTSRVANYILQLRAGFPDSDQARYLDKAG